MIPSYELIKHVKRKLPKFLFLPEKILSCPKFWGAAETPLPLTPTVQHIGAGKKRSHLVQTTCRKRNKNFLLAL